MSNMEVEVVIWNLEQRKKTLEKEVHELNECIFALKKEYNELSYEIECMKNRNA